MILKKIIILYALFLLTFTNFSYANLIDEEPFDFEKMQHEITETSSNFNSLPDLNSRAAIVLDRTSKKILFGKCENESKKMASTTKIMTAIIVIENSNLYDTVTISKKAASTGGSNLGINTDDKITVCDLLYGLLLKSGNDAAVALAEFSSGSVENFTNKMNEKAKELNLENTHFVTPHGLDNDEHFTTAYELALLTDYALNNKTFYNIVSTKNYTVTINGIPKTIKNTNELLGNLNGVYGVKTGFTNGANRCLVTACKRDNFDIICVVLGADTKKNRTQDSINLINYTYKTFEMFDLKTYINNYFNEWKKSNLQNFDINKAKNKTLDLQLQENITLFPIKKDIKNNIITSVDCNYNLQSPIQKNTQIGTLTVNLGYDTILKYSIINTSIIEKKNTFYYLFEFLSNYFNYLTMTV